MDPDLTIVLLGNTGVGKSSSGNSILRRRVFEANSNFKAVTRETSRATGLIDGRQIKVVDTPGILGSKQQIRTICEEFLRSSTPCLFLVVIRLGPFFKEDQEAVEAAIDILRQDGLRKSFLLFTGGDALSHRWLEDFIHTEGGRPLQAVVDRFEGRLHLFNNQHGGQEQEVRELLVKSDHLHRSASADFPVVPARLEERRIVLLGRPGGGKSSSGNTILGSGRFRTDCGFGLVSRECESESKEVEGRQVTVVDTPGFTDKVLTPKQLYMQIMRSIVKASPGPHAFVIVVRLGNISEADKKLFEILPKLFGAAEASKYSMVLFTHGDGLRGRSMDEMIQSNKHVSKLVSRCGGRYCLFNNHQRGNRQQVRRFLDKVDEMVSENEGEHFTSDLFRMAETFIREERNLAAQSDGGDEPDPDKRIKTRVWERLSCFLLIGLVLGAGLGAAVGARMGGVGSEVVGGKGGGMEGGMEGGMGGAGVGLVIGAGVGLAIGAGVGLVMGQG